MTVDWRRVTEDHVDYFISVGWVKEGSLRITRGCMDKICNFVAGKAGVKLKQQTFGKTWVTLIKKRVLQRRLLDEAPPREAEPAPQVLPPQEAATTNLQAVAKVCTVVRDLGGNIENVIMVLAGFEETVAGLKTQVGGLELRMTERDNQLKNVEDQMFQLMEANRILTETQAASLECFTGIDKIASQLEEELNRLTK